jgi:histidine triad (HIT) family protein
MTIFSKILNKEIPAEIVYEDKICMAFKDINPQAPTHVLLIPREEIPTHADVDENHQELMGHLMVKAKEIAEKLNLTEHGYRLVINTKEQGGQEVPHLHIHILGGRQMRWPPG